MPTKLFGHVVLRTAFVSEVCIIPAPTMSSHIIHSRLDFDFGILPIYLVYLASVALHVSTATHRADTHLITANPRHLHCPSQRRITTAPQYPRRKPNTHDTNPPSQSPSMAWESV